MLTSFEYGKTRFKRPLSVTKFLIHAAKIQNMKIALGFHLAKLNIEDVARRWKIFSLPKLPLCVFIGKKYGRRRFFSCDKIYIDWAWLYCRLLWRRQEKMRWERERKKAQLCMIMPTATMCVYTTISCQSWWKSEEWAWVTQSVCTTIHTLAFMV